MQINDADTKKFKKTCKYVSTIVPVFHRYIPSRFKKYLELKGVKRGQGARNDLTSATVAQVEDAAADLGVPERTARFRMEQHDIYEKTI